MPKFLRRTWNRYSKLGKRRKKKQVWRRPTGRDNKMREKRKGYPAIVSVGYKKGEKQRGIIKNKKSVLVMNIKDLEKVGKNEIAIIGKVGKKKKIELAKKAMQAIKSPTSSKQSDDSSTKEMKIKIYNLNPKKFLKKLEKEKIRKGKLKKELEEKQKKKPKKENKKERKK